MLLRCALVAVAVLPAFAFSQTKITRIDGEWMRQDSLSLTLQAVLRSYGRQVGYDTIACFTGNAFGPMLNLRETCCSWWHVESSLGTRNMQFAAQNLGLRATPLRYSVKPGEKRDRAVGALKKALSEATVISEGGWEQEGHWQMAGVVTRVDGQGKVWGIPAFGDGEACLDNDVRLWALRPVRVPKAAWATNREMIQLALQRLNGTGPYRIADMCVYGLPAMDRVIDRMYSIVGFCPACSGRKEASWGCATDTFKSIEGGMAAAASVLNGVVATAPAECRPLIRRAATCFLQARQHLAAQTTEDSLKAIIGDWDRQKRFSEEVLLPARKDMVDGAQALAAALALSA